MSAKHYDILIVGAGVLGVTTAYWLSQMFDCSIGVVDKERVPASHGSTRNTGIVHRPYYLDPDKKKVFARSALASHALWKVLADKFGVPWERSGTLEVAVGDHDLEVLDQHMAWGIRNGMKEDEMTILDSSELRKLEPEVSSEGGLLSRNDVSTDFGSLTRAVLGLAREDGVDFLPGFRVDRLSKASDGVRVESARSPYGSVACRLVLNLAGGGAIGLAHASGLGTEYASLFFRGEYWSVTGPLAPRVRRNIYTVPKHKGFPFLDPHFIIRADGLRQVGPNAVPVTGPFEYGGGALGFSSELISWPLGPKVRLLFRPEFISLAWSEWKSSVSKNAMCERVRRFIPGMRPEMLSQRGLAGVRTSVIDRRGFVPEAVELFGEDALHVVNYNSPGATGAPAYAAYLVNMIRSKGMLERVRPRASNNSVWNFESVLSQLDLS